MTPKIRIIERACYDIAGRWFTNENALNHYSSSWHAARPPGLSWDRPEDRERLVMWFTGKLHNHDLQPVFSYQWYEDDDGSRVLSRINIESRTWVRGKWPWLRKVLQRVPWCHKQEFYLNIEFITGVGSRKNSWKGGVRGMSFVMKKGESASYAWSRFVAERPVG